jgi:AbrB family looped-hinge helix DNA binding protein
MSKIGIMKGFDKLGRIVIPKELRMRFGLNEEVEIIATVDGVLLKNPDYILVKKDEVTDQNADGGNVR